MNDSTQVKGKVTVGTAVTVEYQAMESGENLARVSPHKASKEANPFHYHRAKGGTNR